MCYNVLRRKPRTDEFSACLCVIYSSSSHLISSHIVVAIRDAMTERRNSSMLISFILLLDIYMKNMKSTDFLVGAFYMLSYLILVEVFLNPVSKFIALGKDGS